VVTRNVRRIITDSSQYGVVLFVSVSVVVF
jgi:hypothetical protein